MKNFLVIGFYPDNGQRFADEVEANSPNAAEDKILKKYNISICGVIEVKKPGSVKLCDERNYINAECESRD